MPEKIRRQIYELSLEDLSASLAWEFALDEEGEPDQDEATVRPYIFSGILDPSAGRFIVTARFWLADGTQLLGYLTPPSSDDRSLGTTQPQIVTERGQGSFWYGCLPPATAHAYQLLGREAASVFPIRFESNVPLAGGSVSGTISGFLCLESDLETVRAVQ
ncbi:hypothetical protein BH09VER1_BH09VER1_55450 [soil metagenome]